MRNLNEVFRKDVTYDNIKSHKKSKYHRLFRRYIFEKMCTIPPAVSGLHLVRLILFRFSFSNIVLHNTL